MRANVNDLIEYSYEGELFIGRVTTTYSPGNNTVLIEANYGEGRIEEDQIIKVLTKETNPEYFL